ncbi:RlpA-like double-psi beta-barrel-protein domain-containing protein-containing protein [Sparassis latifolia]|uniref:RlpA-like protein double-psi beta-barrel domain-containing protein n=1 Tax=Sparassis crispa TaxID=139825 RepID=A0A401GLT5_9APHY|nr:hypothetical protein SCP_0501790 [Sparassis crispa]GBE83132.1 hypothetical protein SCP_0501790 [Sparassis crispa]
MPRLATLIFVICVLASAAFSSPVPDNGASLVKRITHTGRGTWFDVGLGACGYTDQNSDHIVAISHDIYGSGGNCNQYMAITNNANGVTVIGRTRDKCMGCNANDIDMSRSLFEALGAALSVGVLDVSWHFENWDYNP